MLNEVLKLTNYGFPDTRKNDFELIYKIEVAIENNKKTLTFSISLADLEDDVSVLLLLEDQLEDYLQDTFCSCSFNESQNHCDCEIDYSWDYNYSLVEIIKTKQHRLI